MYITRKSKYRRHEEDLSSVTFLVAERGSGLPADEKWRNLVSFFAVSLLPRVYEIELIPVEMGAS